MKIHFFSILAVMAALYSSSVSADDYQTASTVEENVDRAPVKAINIDEYRRSLQIKSGGYSAINNGVLQQQKSMMIQRDKEHEKCVERASSQQELMECRPMHRNNSFGGNIQVNGINNVQNTSPFENRQ